MAEKHKAQLDVEEFHRALDIPVGETPAITRATLRAALIMEEAVEASEAMSGGNIEWDWNTPAGSFPASLIQTIDGLVDLLVVTYGAAVEFGIDLAPFWDEVHRTNMAKKGGPVRADGKRLKPEGWEPPQIARILDEQLQ